MKKKTFKILVSLVLILAILVPYVQSIAANFIPIKNKKLGAKNDTKTIKTTLFDGGDEKTGTVPSSNTIYDKKGYYRYINNIEGLQQSPGGIPTGEIYIREIKGDSANEEDTRSAFYCLNPSREFPPDTNGTTYTSMGTLDDGEGSITDAELAPLLDKSTTKAELREFIKKLYIKDSIATERPSHSVYEKAQKDIIADTLVDPLNRDTIYQFLTDDDIKVAQQWALWSLTSNATLPNNSIVYRDLDGDAGDDTPLGEGAYKSDRNALFLNLSNTFNTNVTTQVPNDTTITSNLSHVLFEDNGVNYVDYGTFTVNSLRPDLITSVKLYNHNGNPITSGYDIFIGESAAMGTAFGTPFTTETLEEGIKSGNLLNEEFFLRFNNPDDVLGVTLRVDFLYDFNVKGEIFKADDNTHQNILKVTRNPVYRNKQVTYERQDKITDLALRKFITDINNEPVDSRIPVLSEENFAVEKAPQTTAKYAHKKNPLIVKRGDIVTYKMRVYNEAKKEETLSSVIDILPDGLSLSGTNPDWTIVETLSDGRTVLKYEPATPVSIPAATQDPVSSNYTFNYHEITLNIVIDNDAPAGIELTNIAFINAQGEIDIDSRPGAISKDNDNDIYSITNDQLPNYRGYGNDGETLDQPTRYYKGYEDDDDFEKVIIEPFDLALRKFITNINDDGDPNTSTDNVNRQPVVDVTKLVNKTATTATYNHPKTPVEVQKGDLVTYTIRVYNEELVNAYVKEIKDHLPSGIAYLPQHTKNIDNGWSIVSGTEASVADYPEIDFKLRKADLPGVTNLEDTLLAVNSPVLTTNVMQGQEIPAFDPSREAEGLSYVDVEIVGVVIEDRKFDSNDNYIGNLRNWAEITDDADFEHDPVIDRDSTPNNWENHKNGPEYEDDEDYEDLTTTHMRFDLALQKFITQIFSSAEARAKTPEQLKDRVPIAKIDADNNITYTKKDETPPLVHTGDIVVYTIRVYNEGDIAGFAKKVRDTIPEGLTYLADHEINQRYQWYFIDKDGNVVANIENAKYIETEYLSRDKAIERENANQEPNVANTIIQPFDKTTKNIYSRDLQIAFQVNEKAKPGANNLKNIAEISDDEDEDGNPVDDEDSTPANDVPTEDDIDDENLQVTYFDLALLKIVTNVEITENGKTRNIPTGHIFDMIPEPVVKTDLDERYLDKTQVKYTYKIRVENQGLVEGYATKISDYIPQGLEFFAEDQKNNKWTEPKKGLIETTDLADKLLQPGETATVEVVLRWINHKNNMGIKTNVAEITEDHNEYDLPDIDSVPANKRPGEDDIDDASVILAIRTGAVETFFTVSLTMALIISTGTILIRKYIV